MKEAIAKVLSLFSDEANAGKVETLTTAWPELAEALSEAKAAHTTDEGSDEGDE